MSKPGNCWLCDRGTGLDNGSMNPGELQINFFGDIECIYCTARMNFTIELLSNPEMIPLMSALQKLPKVPNVSIGIRIEHDEEYPA